MFVYDSVGNVLVKQHQGQPPQTMQQDAANRLTTLTWGSTVTGYSFNAAGNMTAENQAGAITGYICDGENRLLQTTYPDFSISKYTYQGDGMRRTKQDPKKPTRTAVRTLVWDGSDYLGRLKMAMSVYYPTVAGEIVSENRNGVESFYTPDTNGNTMRLRNVNGTVTDEWTYWPYGEVRTRTGTTPTPFTFGGVVGYYAEQLGNKFYVRARYLQTFLARWLTVDPLWPREEAYGYVQSAPTWNIDPSGLGEDMYDIFAICTCGPKWPPFSNERYNCCNPQYSQCRTECWNTYLATLAVAGLGITICGIWAAVAQALSILCAILILILVVLAIIATILLDNCLRSCKTCWTACVSIPWRCFNPPVGGG
jgi:RHS repeat-associated protein